MTDATATGLDLSQLAARGAVAAAATAATSLLLLHVLQPELPLGRSMISQYAIGNQGWLMGVCFFAFALAGLFLLVSLVGVVKGPLGWLGLLALAAAVVGLAMGGAFPMDPVTTDPAAMSFSGRMHGMAFMIGVPGEILAVLLLSLALRGNPDWNGGLLLALTAFVWISLGIMAWALMTFMKDTSAPTVMGWFNRAFMLGFAAWVAVAAWPRIR